MRRAIAVLCSMALLLTALAPAAAAAHPSSASPIRGVVDMAFGPCPMEPAIPVLDPSQCWFGYVQGDLGGVVAFWEDPPGAPVSPHASAWHFFEKFTFRPEGGGWFAGTEKGQWNMGTGAFRASGPVTAASPEWAGVVGHRFHESGVAICDEQGCTGFGTRFFLAKGSGSPWP